MNPIHSIPWVPVEDRLPKIPKHYAKKDRINLTERKASRKVLVWCQDSEKHGFPLIARYSYKYNCWLGAMKVTHWARITKP